MREQIVEVHSKTRNVKAMGSFGRCSVAAEVGSYDMILFGKDWNVSLERLR